MTIQQQILELQTQGLGYRKIAKQLGCKLSTARYHCYPQEHKHNQHRNVIWRQEQKKKLVDFKGGRCEICHYDKCLAALEFHHTAPQHKDFGISRLLGYSLVRLQRELEKCQLLCSNCHREIHEKLMVG